MPFVTTLRLRSGDRQELDDVVAEVKQRAARKGIELKGPHARPSDALRVPQYKRPADPDGGRYAPWHYTVYTRTIEIHGYGDFTRTMTEDVITGAIQAAVTVEQVRASGS